MIGASSLIGVKFSHKFGGICMMSELQFLHNFSRKHFFYNILIAFVFFSLSLQPLMEFPANQNSCGFC